MSDNKIGSFGTYISYLSGIEFMDFSYNCIEGLEGIDIKAMSGLKILRVSHNLIKDVT